MKLSDASSRGGGLLKLSEAHVHGALLLHLLQQPCSEAQGLGLLQAQ